MKLPKLFWVVVGAALVAIPTTILELLKPEPKTLDSSIYLVLFEPSTFHPVGELPSIPQMDQMQKDMANEHLRHRDNETDPYVVKIAIECGLRRFRADALVADSYPVKTRLVWIPISERSNGALKCAIERAIREKIDYSLLRLTSDGEANRPPNRGPWAHIDDRIRKH